MTDLVDTAYRRDDAGAIDFCRRFLSANRPRFVFGTNGYARAIGERVPVDGFIDDYTRETTCDGRPILRTESVPPGSLVVSGVVLGRPWSARRRLDAAGIENLDYYAFSRHGGLDIPPPFFWTDFRGEFEAHRAEWEALHARLADQESRRQFRDIVNFRLSGDLHFMQGYADIQDRQYFEDFLHLQAQGEVFCDVGGFDGYTTEQFVRHCPGYACAHLFEPVEGNMTIAQKRLSGLRDIHFHAYGLSDRKQTLRFSVNGSGSRLDATGESEIHLDRLDRLVTDPVTFIKMDIEGAEADALSGSESLIRRFHPRLAIAAYHRVDDFRVIPDRVLSIRDDYDIHLRHYTEGTTETVLFFIPAGKK